MDNPAAVPPGRIRLLPYFRIIWGAKEAMRGNWYVGLIGFHTKGYPRELWIYLSLRGFLRWSAGTLIVTYFVGAAALTWFFSRNPYNKITYSDLILPSHWSELRTLRGEANIEEGLAKLKAKQYGVAFMLLNQGLARKPDNLSARLVVARMYTSMGYFPRAMKIYRAGLPYAGEQRRFVSAAIQLAEYTEDYEMVLCLIKEAEAVVPADSQLFRTFLQEKRILAYEKLGRYDDIEALWVANQSKPTMRLNAAHLRTLATKGKTAEAIAALEANPEQYGLLREPWELLLELAKIAKNNAVGRRAVDALVALEPSRYRFYIKRIAYLDEIGAQSEALLSVDDYFLRFGADPAAVAMLLKGAESNPTRALVQHIWAEAQASGQVGPAARMSYVQNLLRLGDINLAQQEFVLTRRQIESMNYPHGGWLEGTEALLGIMVSDSPSSRSLLQTYAAGRPLPPAAFRTLVDALLRSSRQDAAHEMALLARKRYPSIRDIPADALKTPASAALVAITPKSHETEIVVPLTEARQELTALEAAIQAAQWTAALAHITTIEKSPLAKELSDQLLYQRIAIHGHLSEQTEVSWYMRRLLESFRLDTTRIRALALKLHETGHVNSAQTILREVLRKHPDAKWAADQLRTWATET